MRDKNLPCQTDNGIHSFSCIPGSAWKHLHQVTESSVWLILNPHFCIQNREQLFQTRWPAYVALSGNNIEGLTSLRNDSHPPRGHCMALFQQCSRNRQTKISLPSLPHSVVKPLIRSKDKGIRFWQTDTITSKLNCIKGKGGTAPCHPAHRDLLIVTYNVASKGGVLPISSPQSTNPSETKPGSPTDPRHPRILQIYNMFGEPHSRELKFLRFFENILDSGSNGGLHFLPLLT